MTPIEVYKSGDCYNVKDGSRLAIAPALGKAYILAEVWERPAG